ncbi:DUF6049 family protein [Gordonia sp. SL306]|uniref:DUF6049 family protein n=1 Tax=Gordonia sp. SL306 TaxID=2995145 RepID=UPI002270E2D1|nr:DUF6049 family protein [Gordonia sp. SL306]WAC57694.1 DUF6049 family protein [Gordonia sp. SL306]
MPDRRVNRLLAPLRRLARISAAIFAVLTIVLLSAAPAAAAPDASAASDGEIPDDFLRLSIDTITPSLVTSSGGSVVTVSGHLQNIGDRQLHNLSVRLERGDRVADAAGLRSSLAVTPVPVSAATPFRHISDDLTPGRSIPFTITAPLSGNGGLDIQRTGVFPLQVNVNGLPDYGNPAKLAQSRTLLPVLSLPPDRGRAAGYVDPTTDAEQPDPRDTDLGADGSVSANLSSPARFTMLWPLAAPPQLTPGVLGGQTEQVRLVGDDLARSLEPGGRLNVLLAAARSVAGETESADNDSAASGSEAVTSGNGASKSAESAPPSGDDNSSSDTGNSGDTGTSTDRKPSKLEQSMCLAVDPDLLVTVRSMSLGYEVSSDPMDPTSSTTAGSGQAAAVQWLTELRQLAGQMCVVALPFAQSDLTSLARIGNTGLTTDALSTPPDVVDAILGVRSVRGITVPALGALDSTGAGVLKSASVGKAVTSTSSVATARPGATGQYRVGDLRVQSTDAPISASLAGLGSAPSTTPLTPPDQEVSFAGESAAGRRQAAVAALAFQSIAAPEPVERGRAQPRLPAAGRSAFVVPPTYWAPSTDDTNALFTTATLLLESGAATPTSLTDVVGELDRAESTARFVRPPGVASLASLGVAVSDQAATTMRDNAELSYQLQASLMQSADVAATPERYMAPLREDLLRSIRTPDRAGAAERADIRTQRAARVTASGATLQRMRNAVTILDPGGRYTLASERSPLLLVVRNELSLPIRVRMNVAAPKELDVGDIGVIEIPARGTRQIQLPTRADSSEAITVTIGMSTSSGVSLGSPIRLSVHANAYGKPLFWITIAAGVALVLLTARRLWHRFRGEPDPADDDRPDPDDHERLLAGTTYQERRRTLHQEMLHPETDPEPENPETEDEAPPATTGPTDRDTP